MPTQVKSFAQPAIGSILYTLAVVLYAMSAAVLAMLAVPLFSLLVAVSAAGPTARDETDAQNGRKLYAPATASRSAPQSSTIQADQQQEQCLQSMLQQRPERQDAATAKAAAQQRQDPSAAGSVPQPPAAPLALDGRLLATCQELGLLGQGAYGVVHRVLVTPASGAPFEAARKRLPARPAEAMQLFAAEVEALKAGRGCRNVVQILDVRCTPEYNEILLELLKGGTLADELTSTRQVRLPEARVKALAVDTLQGLAFLHARNICCRDIKLSNVMTREVGGEAVLVDLGLACRADKNGRLARGCAGVGSLGQMAPEMRPGCPVRAGSRPGKAGLTEESMRLPPPTVKCDVFCLGQTLATCAVRGGGDLGRLSSAPLRQFLEQLVAEHPDERLSAVEAFQHPYLAAAQH